MRFVPNIISIIYSFVVKCYVKVYSARPTSLMLFSCLCLTVDQNQTYPDLPNLPNSWRSRFSSNFGGCPFSDSWLPIQGCPWQSVVSFYWTAALNEPPGGFTISSRPGTACKVHIWCYRLLEQTPTHHQICSLWPPLYLLPQEYSLPTTKVAGCGCFYQTWWLSQL